MLESNFSKSRFGMLKDDQVTCDASSRHLQRADNTVLCLFATHIGKQRHKKIESLSRSSAKGLTFALAACLLPLRTRRKLRLYILHGKTCLFSAHSVKIWAFYAHAPIFSGLFYSGVFAWDSLFLNTGLPRVGFICRQTRVRWQIQLIMLALNLR